MPKKSERVIDPTIELIHKIYAQPVPLKSELSNPFAANRRKRKTIDTRLESDVLDADVSKWETRDFCKYFAQEYKAHIGGTYKITYTSDQMVVREIFDFMEDNKLPKNEDCKKFIDWCFQNKNIIIQQTGYLMPSTIRHFLNRYYQDSIVPQHSSNYKIDIYDELAILDKTGKHRELYSKFGIPIASTYFINKKNIPEEAVIDNLHLLFDTLASGNSEQKQFLTNIIQKSINRSPYIPEMNLLNWRGVFEDILVKYKSEKWWREEDYIGSPRFDFKKLIYENKLT
jgi:hypothetical protein